MGLKTIAIRFLFFAFFVGMLIGWWFKRKSENTIKDSACCTVSTELKCSEGKRIDDLMDPGFIPSSSTILLIILFCTIGYLLYDWFTLTSAETKVKYRQGIQSTAVKGLQKLAPKVE